MWASTVNGHEEKLLGLHDLEQLLQVVEHFDNHFCLCQFCAWIIAMRAIVDDPIHIQVQVVYFWHVGFCYGLIHEWVSLAQPSVELWNTCRPV